MDNPVSTQSGFPTKVIGVRIAAAFAVILVLALMAPLIWSAASAGAGLITLGALGLVGAGLLKTIPLLSQKFENRLLAARKKEARQNPIEQLQNFLIEKSRRVDLFRSAVANIGAQIKGLGDMVEERKRSKPGYDASKQEKSIEAMRAAHTLLVKKYQDAEKALKQLHEVIDDKKFEWSFGQAGQLAIQSLNDTSGQQLLDQMLADEAFSSVRDNFNHVFAELELEAAKLSSARELTFEGGMTLDVSSIRIPETQPIRG